MLLGGVSPGSYLARQELQGRFPLGVQLPRDPSQQGSRQLPPVIGHEVLHGGVCATWGQSKDRAGFGGCPPPSGGCWLVLISIFFLSSKNSSGNRALRHEEAPHLKKRRATALYFLRLSLDPAPDRRVLSSPRERGQSSTGRRLVGKDLKCQRV